jgi:GNAT superfamily N-acetyltransferase
VKIFDYKNDFLERALPEGFTLIDGTDMDFAKLHACYWKGFNHGPWPPNDIDGRLLMYSGPRADKSLTTIVVAPDGEYACALGMWYDERNRYAYLEPLATVPKYRRMGLATVALTEAMKKTKALGAEYCFGGSREFYTAIGFETIRDIEFWEKKW